MSALALTAFAKKTTIDDVTPSIFQVQTKLEDGFHRSGAFLDTSGSKTIRESRSGDKSDELKDRSFVHDHVCAARPLRGCRLVRRTPVDFELGSRTVSCGERELSPASCGGVCGTAESSVYSATYISPRRRHLLQHSIAVRIRGAPLGERVQPKSALRSEGIMARRGSSASHPLNTSPSRT